jgi:hypothetical protein
MFVAAQLKKTPSIISAFLLVADEATETHQNQEDFLFSTFRKLAAKNSDFNAETIDEIIEGANMQDDYEASISMIENEIRGCTSTMEAKDVAAVLLNDLDLRETNEEEPNLFIGAHMSEFADALEEAFPALVIVTKEQVESWQGSDNLDADSLLSFIAELLNESPENVASIKGDIIDYGNQFE